METWKALAINRLEKELVGLSMRLKVKPPKSIRDYEDMRIKEWKLRRLKSDETVKI